MITCASFLSENARPIYERIVGHLQQEAGVEARLLPAMDWNERHQLLNGGAIQVAFLCGLPYAELHDRAGGGVTLLAVPVMRAARYQDRPVYFTDVIVRADSRIETFEDLRGAAYVYNGTDSNSGYNMPRDFLLSRGETGGFFGRTVRSGSHQRSIEMVLSGAADASGIDSHVLDMEVNLRPDLANRLRVVQAIGPCPSPPVVAAGRLPQAVRARLREALLQMHLWESGQAILRDGLIARFVEVDDAYYNPIREMVRRAQQAGFVELK